MCTDREKPEQVSSDSSVWLYFRCGWCGNPTNKDGGCLSIEHIPFGTENDWNTATQTNGECCPNGDEQHRHNEEEI